MRSKLYTETVNRNNVLGTMSKIMTLILLILCLGCFTNSAMADEGVINEEEEKEKKEHKPVREPFGSSLLINKETGNIPVAKTLEFIIMHRFGLLNSEGFDMFGLYAPSNIRLALEYSLTNNLQIGLGSVKNNKLQDISWKYKLFEQTRSNSYPVGLTYYGNAEIDVRANESFGEDYQKADRVSYFHQLIISRRVNQMISLQAALSYAHFNQIDTTEVPGMKHDNYAVSLSGRVKFSSQGAVLFEYDHPLSTPDEIKPNLGLGVEISTGSHAFQIFATTHNAISPQESIFFNTNDFLKKEMLLGFNITRLWNF